MLFLITKNEEGGIYKVHRQKKVVGILGWENSACHVSKTLSFLVFVVRKWSLSLCLPLSVSSRRVSKRGSLFLRQRLAGEICDSVGKHSVYLYLASSVARLLQPPGLARDPFCPTIEDWW